MPEINKIQGVLYNARDPYHFEYDNLPLKNILARIDLVNAQVDIDANILRGAVGSTGSLADRLSVSLNDDGSLKTEAVDISYHSIASHQDGSISGISYVRMKEWERNKLDLIDSEANALDIEVEGISQISILTSGTARLKHSDSIYFSLENPDIIRAHTVFPPSAAHSHHYDIKPYAGPAPNYKHFQTTTFPTAFIEGTLRVHVNGTRICSNTVDSPYAVYVYDEDTGGFAMKITYVTSIEPELGTFSLNRKLTPSDVIRIDFDTNFV